MNDFITALILGIVEGITEFLPISSTGHLILVNQWFSFSSPQFTQTFDIVIQTGAIFAVVLFFWKRIFPWGQGEAHRKTSYSLWARTIVGFLPAVFIALIFDHFIGDRLESPIPVACALILWGIVLILLELKNKSKENAGKTPALTDAATFDWKTVIFIGCFQCLAFWPGTSRSAATIVGAMLLGSTRVAAAEFSFFLAIPTLFGAGAFKLIKLVKSHVAMTSHDMIVLAIGTVVSFLVAWAVVAAFMKFITKHDFKGFGIYRIILGVIVLGSFILLPR